MTIQLHRNWWAIVLRGTIAILFGLLAIIWPGITIKVLVLLFGAFALVDGMFTLVAAIRNRSGLYRFWAEFEGIVGIAAGILTLIWPRVTATALVYLIAIWAIVTGIFEILAAFELRKVVTGEWRLVLGGILSLVLGVLIAFFPHAGAVSIVWLIGLYAILFGILLVTLGVRARRLDKELSDLTV